MLANPLSAILKFPPPFKLVLAWAIRAVTITAIRAVDMEMNLGFIPSVLVTDAFGHRCQCRVALGFEPVKVGVG